MQFIRQFFTPFYLPVYVLFALLISGCGQKKEYKNNKEHVKIGQELVGKFYKQISKNDINKAVFFFSDNVPKTEIITLLKRNRELFGKLNEIKFIGASSNITESKHQLNGEMNLIFEATYGRLSTTENFAISVINDSLKIEGYDYKVNMKKLQER